jgi:phosphoglycolate phosphatase-like HAD superfamily hydrolase
MFELCLFDLDDTLVRTEDLETIRKEAKDDDREDYALRLVEALKKRGDRHIYSAALLGKIRARFPDLKLGVFTRSPKKYASTVLAWAYPNFEWDILVAYEDVKHTKPYGDGIDHAMRTFGILTNEHLATTMLVGDNSWDIRSAYHCGCIAVLDKSAWPSKWLPEHWRAMELVPDAIMTKPDEILEVLTNADRFLPELERVIAGNAPRYGKPRFDKLGHFVSKAAGGDTTSHQIYICGRLFPHYDSVVFRRQVHALTNLIEDNKDSEVFPAEWIDTVRTFIKDQFPAFFGTLNIGVAVVPHRPGRKPRLEQFLEQLEASLNADPIAHRNVTTHPGLFAYRNGVRSHHGEHLGRDARFINVRDHLFVQQPEQIKPNVSFLIIDDVVTTGASLIYARKYLKDGGAGDVKCLALAKNVGDVLP